MTNTLRKSKCQLENIARGATDHTVIAIAATVQQNAPFRI